MTDAVPIRADANLQAVPDMPIEIEVVRSLGSTCLPPAAVATEPAPPPVADVVTATPEPPVMPDPPASPAAADVREAQVDLPLDVVWLLAFHREVSLEVLGAAVLLQAWSWNQLPISSLPAGSLPDDDQALAALVGLRRDVWQRMRPQALDGFQRHSDGRLYHPGLVEKAVATLAEAERREKRRVDDARRQRELYARRKAKQNGDGTPEPTAETPFIGGVASPEEFGAEPRSGRHSIETTPSPPNEPAGVAKSHDDPKAEATSAPSIREQLMASIARSSREAKPKPKADPKLSREEWDALITKYRVTGQWQWREHGPSPLSPECRAPVRILIEHGYGPQAT
jgi:hypothetical protein